MRIIPGTIVGFQRREFIISIVDNFRTGIFDDPAKLHPVYTPGTDDVLNGSVILTFTATAAEPLPGCTDNLY